MDRVWFLTWHTYGTWLPGDERGFVDPIRDDEGKRVIHNQPGTPTDADNPGLRRYARSIMKGEALVLVNDQASALLSQLHETAKYRGWTLLAVAIMVTHVHLIVGVPGDPEPTTLLRDFKSYGSRCLNRRWGTPANGSWWSESGSTRIVKGDEYLCAAIRYVVERQENPLLTWSAPSGERPA